MNFSKKDLAEAFAEGNAKFLEKLVSIEMSSNVDDKGRVVNAQTKIFHSFEGIINPLTFETKVTVNVITEDLNQDIRS